MEFRILGPLEVWADDRPLQLGRGKQRALLAALLLEANRVVSSDRLIDALWGESPPPTASAVLHNYVSRLRRLLGPGVVHTRPAGYVLQVNPEFVDAVRFERLVGEAAVRDDPARRVAALREALALWRGPALADLAFEPFALPEVARLEELRLAAVEDRIECELSLGRHGLVVGELEALVAEYPLRERPRGLLMQALYASGRQAEALEEYREARGALVEELGIEPGDELQRLERAILAHDPSLTPGPAAECGLPAPVTRLIGRRAEVASACDLVRQGARLLTFTGPGGSGKTRLALAVAEEIAADFPDGAAFAELASLADPELVMGTIARALELRDADEDPLGALKRALRSSCLILVVDNFEHLLPAAPVLGELLTAAPRVRLLVTSRTPLHLYGEHELPVPPLPQSDAVALFVQRARAVAPGFQADEAVAEICRRLDGLPLAVELAAARVKLMEPPELLDRLDRGLGLLSDGPRDAPERQRTLRATLDWSYDLLEDREQSAFALLGVFTGGCTTEAAEVVCSADLETLSSLVDQSLLIRENGRFRMLEPVRQYALERLEETGKAEEQRHRYAEHLASFVERARPELAGPDQAAWGTQLDSELPNIRAALRWAQEGRPELMARMAASLWQFWGVRGHVREACTWLEEALVGGAEGLDRVQVLGGLSWLYRQLGNHTRGAEAAQERLSLAGELGDLDSVAGSLSFLAGAAEDENQFERALTLHKRAVAASRSAGDLGHPERQLANLSGFLLRLSRYEEAEQAHDEALALAHARGDTFLIGHLVADGAAFALLDGRPTDALQALREGHVLLNDLGERYGTVYNFPLFAEIFAALDAPEKAARIVGFTDALLQEMGVVFSPDARVQFGRASAEIKSVLGDERFLAVQAEGRCMSFEEATAYALADEPSVVAH